MTEPHLPLPASLEGAMLFRINEGGFVDAAEYGRAPVRRDFVEAEADRRWLQTKIDEGIASGIVDREPQDILAKIIAEDPDLRD